MELYIYQVVLKFKEFDLPEMLTFYINVAVEDNGQSEFLAMQKARQKLLEVDKTLIFCEIEEVNYFTSVYY